MSPCGCAVPSVGTCPAGVSGSLASARDSLAISALTICVWAPFLPFLAHDCWGSWNCLSQPQPCSAPLHRAAPRMWQEPEILLQGRKGCHNFPLAPSTSPFGTAQGRRGKKSSEIAEGRVAPGSRVLGRGIRVGRGWAPGLGLPPQLGSVGVWGEPEDGAAHSAGSCLLPVFHPWEPLCHVFAHPPAGWDLVECCWFPWDHSHFVMIP